MYLQDCFDNVRLVTERGPFPRDNLLLHEEGRGHKAMYGHQPVIYNAKFIGTSSYFSRVAGASYLRHIELSSFSCSF